MKEKCFAYKLMKENEDGTKSIDSIGVVALEEVVNSIKKDNVLYLFLKKENQSQQIVRVPVKVKVTTENPSGWSQDLQVRTVSEPITLQIQEEDDIARYESYIESINI